MPRQAILAVLTSAAAAFAQPQPPEANKPVDLNSLPPPVRLGVRVEAIRRQIKVIPIVVVTPDAASYTAAITKWTVNARFPVLLDDGSPEAAEHIGRFVRAFAPQRVVRFQSQDPWPADVQARRTALENAAAAVWGATAATELGVKWTKIGFVPPGIVIASDNDPAWPAALALAAGHGQPIAWIDAAGDRGGVDQDMALASADSLAGAVERACHATGLPWRDLGDSLDAVTLCLALPAKVLKGADDRVALTDFIGRRDDGAGSGGRVQGQRWAWCGQVFGPEPRSAYWAMCSLFLQPKSAWLFDGYPDTAPFNTWDATKASELLSEAGYETAVIDTPRQGLTDWSFRASLPLQSGLIFVNTRGGTDYFDLEPGRARSGDAPILGVPAIVHFVHSWSAAAPATRDTIAGRWLERGAYCYAGSIQEPFLQAFAPTPAAAGRLAALLPWGAAVRLDDGPAWRITVLGDPLTTLGPPAPQSDAELPLPGVTTIADDLPGLLQSKDFEKALRLLVLLGRDADAARLARGLLDGDPKSLTSPVAAACVLPVFRAAGEGRPVAIARLFGNLSVPDAARPGLRDALWLACLPSLRTQRDDAVLNALLDNIRPEQPGRDAAALAPALRAAQGRPAAESLLARARTMNNNYIDHEAIEAAVRALGGGN